MPPIRTIHLAPQTGRRRRFRLPPTLAWLGGLAFATFALFWLLDFFVTGTMPDGKPRGSLSDLLFSFDVNAMQQALAGLSQVVVAVLGIAITVASIVVQLSATRYTPRVADMFFRDRTNIALMGLFVIACLDAVWTSLAVSTHYMPRATIVVSIVMVTASLLLLIPYFAYLFDFLDPEKVILRLGQYALDAGLARQGFDQAKLQTRQVLMSVNLEHLADIAVNAVAQKDKVIASSAVAAQRELCVQYLTVKARLPPEWFLLTERARENPDFIALALNSLAEIERQKTWVEWKTLRQFRNIFAESLKQLPEMAHVTAIETRYIGQWALQAGDMPVVGVVLKFFNTYLRTAINARDVRAAYNTLNQYRQLGEEVVRAGQDALALEIAGYLKYYGQTAHGHDLGFMTETAAFDLSILCERAFEHKASCHDALLRTFLDVDKEAETKAEEKTLRGVRKAQVRLASYYLLMGAATPARTIFEDMRHESRERLQSIRTELEAVTAKDFWEVTDRGVNFDYLEEPRKQKLGAFFAWFDP